MIQPVFIKARDIPDAWFQCVNQVQEVGFRYEIQQGSYVGQTRLEFDWITIQIDYPYSEPYDTMLPEIPQHLGIPNPVANGYIDQYLPYLMTGEKQEGEDYTYGQRLISAVLYKYGDEWIKRLRNINQVDRFVELFKETPNTNQAILQIAEPMDCVLKDPPCLRHIDMRVKDGALIFYPYFRSWDLWGGFPANLAAITILQHYMATMINVDIGPMVASSKGLHLYGYVEELAKVRCAK